MQSYYRESTRPTPHVFPNSLVQPSEKSVISFLSSVLSSSKWHLCSPESPTVSFFPFPRGFPNVPFKHNPCNSSDVRLIVHVPAFVVLSPRKIVEWSTRSTPLILHRSVARYVCNSFVCIRRLPSKWARALPLIKIIPLYFPPSPSLSLSLFFFHFLSFFFRTLFYNTLIFCTSFLLLLGFSRVWFISMLLRPHCIYRLANWFTMFMFLL